ncbi:hypothetical protein ACFPAF_00625 [Hymenobacter endophyticus]|uniref:DUF4389 domain-containing protein n=1 Tax=Hymenobacter endophyticus TaxID=3076335 RepID=A0ABU3TBY9_9BACT|nr:hypothetical protein [Hymenobacter endophyticus]MDU0368881.1 hypothetical protein [Hymenobacter endophyticus]
MRTPIALSLLRRLGRAAAYFVFQLALVLAYALRSVGAVRLPWHFSHAADEEGPVMALGPRRRTRPRTSLTARPAL